MYCIILVTYLTFIVWGSNTADTLSGGVSQIVVQHERCEPAARVAADRMQETLRHI